MDKKSLMYSKTLAIVVIILFVCVSFNPCVTADDFEKDNRSKDVYEYNKETLDLSHVGQFPEDFKVSALAIPWNNPPYTPYDPIPPDGAENFSGGGNTLYVGGSGEGNYTKIQDAIDNASDGDTVFVYDDSSPYYEYIIINKSIDFFGENMDTTILNGFYHTVVVNISADRVRMSGFNIISDRYSVSVGLEIKSNDNTIINNYISDCWFGMLISGSNNIISNNIINSVVLYGIGLGLSSNNLIKNNNISKPSIGIALYECDNNKIENNKISYNGIGLLLNESNSNIISTSNMIENNDEGIILSYSENNIIESNIIKNCERGINLRLSKNNIIQKNNFLRNKRHAYFENCRNKWRNNFWNRPRLLPKAILGAIRIDQPWPFQDIVIHWINFDLRPSLKRYDI